MSKPLESAKVIEDLLLDIEEEKCVLLIGPEIGGKDSQSQTRFIHQQLLEQEADNIAYYYPNDSLFLFKEDAHKNRAIRRLKRLYRKMEVPTALYKRILELPIPLIVSMTPDTGLSQVAQELGLLHDFKHFRYSGGGAEDVDEPSNDRPLIYNLSGCVSEEESLVLDYEDLFQLLRAILPDGLPNKIRMQLRRAESFLFLGFDFEKWYSQLLLQLLTYERKGRPKFAVRPKLENEDARDFLVHQFQIQFLPNEKSFFDALHDTLSEEGLLRPLSFAEASGPVPTEELMRQVASGKLQDALLGLKRYRLTPEQETRLTALRERHQHWKSKEARGLFLPGESEPVRNQIVHDFLDLLNTLK